MILPTLTPPNSFIRNDNTMNIKLTWIYPHLTVQFGDDWNMQENVKMGCDHVFVVLRTHLKVSTPMNGCHYNAYFAWTRMVLILIKVQQFWCSSDYGLHAHNNHLIWFLRTLWFFEGIFGIQMVRIVGGLTYCNCKGASLLSFAHFGHGISRRNSTMEFFPCGPHKPFTHLIIECDKLV